MNANRLTLLMRCTSVFAAALLSVGALAACSISTPTPTLSPTATVSSSPAVSQEKQASEAISLFFNKVFSKETVDKFQSNFSVAEMKAFILDVATWNPQNPAPWLPSLESTKLVEKVKSLFPELIAQLPQSSSAPNNLPESFALATILIGVSGPAANVASRGVTFVIPESAIKVAADGKSATVAPGSATLVKLNDESTTSSEASFFDKLVLLRVGESWKLDLSTMITNTVPK